MSTSNRRFHRSVIQIEILSEEPLPDHTLCNLELVDAYITDGDCSGKITILSKEEVDSKTMVELLRKQDSDPSFFRLDDEGGDQL